MQQMHLSYTESTVTILRYSLHNKQTEITKKINKQKTFRII